MTRNDPIPPFPKLPLYGAFALVLLTIAGVTAVRLAGAGGTPRSTAAAAKIRDFRFVDRAGGSVSVIDLATNAEAGTLASGEDGFVRGVLRSLARERRANAVGDEPSFRLTRRLDGSIFISDPSTGRDIELDAFGHTNEIGRGHV